MQLLSNIPAAILHNIAFMAILYWVYVLIKQYAALTAKHLFIIAVAFQIISSIDFIYFLVAAPQFSIVRFQNFLATPQWFATYASQLFPSIGILYLICLLFFTSKLLYHFFQLNTIHQKANFADSLKWKKRIGKAIYKNTSIQIGYSHLVNAPVTFGWLDPIILMPFSICNQLSVDQVKTILLHEIAHIIRYDYIVHLLIETCHACLHFNPFSYLFLKEISLQRELACDQWVIQQKQDPFLYTQALYTLVVNAIQYTPSPLFLHAINPQSELLIRIKKMNQLNLPTHFGATFIRYSTIAFVGALMLFTKFNTPQLLPTSSNRNFNGMSILPNINEKQINIVKLANTQTPKRIANKNNTGMANHPILDNNLAIVHEKMHSPVYAKLVDETVQWIKAHESVNQFTSYDNNYESEEFTIAEKLLLRTILKNYQLKRALLNDKLNKIQDEKDAAALLKNSKEYQQVLQYENWTKEFLQQHPGSLLMMDSTSMY